jgi:small subunit ribosomal protein S3
VGQKVNPNLMRIGITTSGMSRWFASKKNFAKNLFADFKIRQFLKKELASAGLISVEIERKSGSTTIKISAARAGVIIGRSGDAIEKLKKTLRQKFGENFDVVVKDQKNSESEAAFLADMVARQLEKRFPFRRAGKTALQKGMEAGAKGVKVQVSGRLGGADIARTETFTKGKIPLHTFRADISFALNEAHTTYGIIGVKVWTFKGEVFGKNKTGVEV